ncbi:MAG TPA: BatA domain-containing protein, partial [Polyangiaceae bacterium]
MSFLVAAALAVGLLVVAPLVAHLLRRGRTPERVFPPAMLVSKLETHSKERARLEDRSLLSLRMAMVLVLALLGATPLVRCSRLSVDRPHGASVAIALVLDDSHS